MRGEFVIATVRPNLVRMAFFKKKKNVSGVAAERACVQGKASNTPS